MTITPSNFIPALVPLLNASAASARSHFPQTRANGRVGHPLTRNIAFTTFPSTHVHDSDWVSGNGDMAITNDVHNDESMDIDIGN